MADLDELADPLVLRIRWRQIADKNYALNELIEQFYIDSGIHTILERTQSVRTTPFYKELKLLEVAIESIDSWLGFEELIQLPKYDVIRLRAKRVRDVVESGWHTVAEELSIPAEFPIDFIGRPFIDPNSDSLFWSLPPDHQQAIRHTNGFSAELGRTRFLGCDRGHPDLNLDLWNAESTWRFAWKSHAQPYLFFAYDQWGSQVAYKRAEDGGCVDPRVYELDARCMQIIRTHNSFADYWGGLRARANQPRSHFLGTDWHLYLRQGPMNPAFLYSMASLITAETATAGEVSVIPSATALILAGQLSETAGFEPVSDH